MNFVSLSFILSISEASSGKFGYATAPNVSYIVIIVSLRLRVSVTRRYPKIDESSLALFLTGIFDLYFYQVRHQMETCMEPVIMCSIFCEKVLFDQN